MKLTFVLVTSLALSLVQACGQAPAQQTSQPFEGESSNGQGQVIIYNASLVLTIPTPLNHGIKVLQDGQVTFQGQVAPLLVSQSAMAASDNLTIVRDFYRDVFQRNSYDDKGAPIRASVDVQRYHLIPILGMKNNAAWMQPFKMFVFGAGGDNLGGFAEALDVIGHEFTHAVVATTSNLEYVGQSGALNEHLADVFGEIIQHEHFPESAPFLIGESVLRGPLAVEARALRDMLHPDLGLSKQPGKMSDIPAEFGSGCVAASGNDNCGVHTLSGIPNRAAALIIQKLGWETSRTLFYSVMTERLTSTSNFADYRNLMVDQCQATLTTTQCDAVSDSFATVGL